MNRLELIAAVTTDTHREDYAADMSRYLTEAEGMIASQLDGYILTDTLGEVDRVEDGIYAMGNGISVVRHVKYQGRPLTQYDESLAYQHRNGGCVVAYTVRDASVLITSEPPLDAEIAVEWYGMPAPLELDDDTNSLLVEYPQLYQMAMKVPVYMRAKDWDAASRMENGVRTLIKDINRRTRKRLGGAQSATPYNVSFRSSM